MKTLEKIIKSKSVFLNDWSDSKLFGLISDFEELNISKEEFEAKEAPYANKEYWLEKVERAKKVLKEWEAKNIKVLFASYSYENYSGDAFVLFEQNGKLYEVNGSHCSCYGLEGQWESEEVVLKELENRLIKGTFGMDSYYNSELKKFLGIES